MLPCHQSIFNITGSHLFLSLIPFSNTGGREITEYVLQQWRKGRSREDIKLVELEDILTRIAFNKEGK